MPPPPTQAPADAAPVAVTPDAAPAPPAEQTVSLKGKDPVAVPGSGLSVFISESFQKIRAPVSGVSVLFSLGDKKAQVGWRIVEGKVAPQGWVELKGRRYDGATNNYVEEHIAGWRVKLVEVNARRSNGAPSAITIAVKKAP